MRTDKKHHDGHSPVEILKELAIEGTSSLVEAQRALLSLVQQENDIIMNGVKERVSGFVPVVTMADLVQRSLDTFIGMQQDFLTTASKQTLHWLEVEKAGRHDRTAYLLQAAREAVETFVHAEKKFLDVLAEETEKVAGRKHEHDGKVVKKTEVSKLAREAGNAFIEAQKKLLDVMGQQMTVNLEAASRTLELLSPSRLLPAADIAGERVRSFIDAERSLIGSLVMPRKQPKAAGKAGRRHKAVHHPA